MHHYRGYTPWTFAKTRLTLDECRAIDAIEAAVLKEECDSGLRRLGPPVQQDALQDLRRSTARLILEARARGELIPQHISPCWWPNGEGKATLYV